MPNIKFFIKTPLLIKAYFLLLMSLIAFLIFIIHGCFINSAEKDIVPWLTVFITFIAAILTGIFAIHNSIKQHTISFWIDVRTSDTYVKALDVVNKFASGNKLNLELIEQKNFKDDIQPHLLQILNHLEFCAVCLRSGDFDEFILKNAMKSIVLRNYEFASPYIENLRIVENKETIFEHLETLYQRWK